MKHIKANIKAHLATSMIIFITVAIYLITGQGLGQNVYYFSFDWQLILSGQVHRLFTPSFLHISSMGFPIALLLYCALFWFLSGKLEKVKGSFYIMGLFLIISTLVNLFMFASDWFLGGFIGTFHTFSGLASVCYGLLGFFVIRKRYDPFFPIVLDQQLIILMGIGLIIGFVGLQAHIFSTAHLFGLLTGGLLGFITAKTKVF